MDNTMLIQITNQKAVGLIHELEELDLIKVLKPNFVHVKQKLFDKYKRDYQYRVRAKPKRTYKKNA